MLLFLILFIFDNVQGLVVRKSVVPSLFPSRTFTKFESFGFEAGGTIKLSSSSTSANLKIYICDQAEYQRRMRLWSDSWLQACVVPDPRFHLIDINEEKRIVVDKSTLLVFGVIDCTGESTAYSVEMEYELLSTAYGEQLSLGEILIPFKQFAFQIIWGIGLFATIVYLILHRDQIVPLHWILLTLVVVKVCICTIETIYWWIYHQQGTRLTILMKTSDCLFALAEAGYFLVLYFLSKGWRITRAGVPIDEVRSVFIGLAIILAALLFFSGYNLEYYWLTLLVMYFFILPKVFTSLTEIMSTLEHQIRALSHFPNFLQLMNHLKEKKLALTSVRSAIVSYFVAVLVINCLVKMLVPWTYLWSVVAVNDLISFIMYMTFCYCLRPKNGLFFLNAADENAYNALNLLNNNSNDEEDSESLNPWDLTKTLVIEWPGNLKPNLSIAYEQTFLDAASSPKGKASDSDNGEASFSM